MRGAHLWQQVTALALALCAATACAGDDCPTLRECDIRERSCQSRTARVAACLRGGDPAAPAVDVVDKDAFVEEQVQSAREAGESPEERDVRRGLALLALMPWTDDTGELTREHWTNVAAFYAPDTGGITILDDGSALDDPGAVILLLHEMIHALQGPELDAAYYEQHAGTFDKELALSALIEGEATLYMDLGKLQGYDVDVEDVDWGSVFETFKRGAWKRERSTDANFTSASSNFSYAFGGAYLNQAYREGGNGAVRAAFALPASSSREIMAGYAVARGVPFRAEPNEVGLPVVPENFERIATFHLGTWLAEVFIDAWSGPDRAFDDYVDSGFSGDVLNIFRGPASDDVTSVWRLRFEQPTQAEAFVSRLLARQWLKAFVEDRDVIVVASTDDRVTETLIEGLTWSRAPERDELPPAMTAARGAVRIACARPTPETH